MCPLKWSTHRKLWVVDYDYFRRIPYVELYLSLKISAEVLVEISLALLADKKTTQKTKQKYKKIKTKTLLIQLISEIEYKPRVIIISTARCDNINLISGIEYKQGIIII